LVIPTPVAPACVVLGVFESSPAERTSFAISSATSFWPAVFQWGYAEFHLFVDVVFKLFATARCIHWSTFALATVVGRRMVGGPA